MSDKPAFPDCVLPDDCECLKRGYQLERARCAVPAVRAAIADLDEPDPAEQHERDTFVPRPREVDWARVPKQALVDALRNSQRASLANLSRQDKSDLIREGDRLLADRDYGPQFLDALMAEVKIQNMGRDMKAMTDTTKPRPAATPFGTVMPLANSGDMAADVREAIDAAGGGELADFTTEEIGRLIHYEKIGQGLRAEAGYSAPFVLLLHRRI
jgi:hypothetical protein